MKLTLASIGHTRRWNSQYGPMASIKLAFIDGQKGELSTKIETLEKRKGELQTLIGKETEFDVQETQYGLKVKIPKPDGGSPNFFSGGRGKSAEERDEIARMAAVKAAVELCASGKIEVREVLPVAQRIVQFIRNSSPTPSGGESNAAGSSPSSPGDSLSGGPAASSNPPGW